MYMCMQVCVGVCVCVMYIAIVCMLIHVARNLKFGGGDQRLYVCVHFRA